MPFVGNQPAQSYSSFAKQDFTTSATTSYTLDNPVANANELALFINFVRQEPTTAYSASGTSLTLTSATSASDDMYCVYLGQAKQTVNAPDGSVGSSQVAASIITGQTALASEPADTDEFLVSDAGTLKKIDYSLIKGGGITEFDMFRLSSSFQGGTQPISSNLERCDTNSFEKIGTGMSESSGIFTFPSAGKYHVIFNTLARNAQSSGERHHQGLIMTTTNNSSYAEAAQASANIGYYSSSVNNTQSAITSIFFDVTDTSTHKVRFDVYANGNSNTYTVGNTGINNTTMTFIRIGDT